jgi:hypothetical protein
MSVLTEWQMLLAAPSWDPWDMAMSKIRSDGWSYMVQMRRCPLSSRGSCEFRTHCLLGTSAYSLFSGFEWTFVFEGWVVAVACSGIWLIVIRRNKYKWNKELYGKDYICSLDRKPDPRVEICL